MNQQKLQKREERRKSLFTTAARGIISDKKLDHLSSNHSDGGKKKKSQYLSKPSPLLNLADTNIYPRNEKPQIYSSNSGIKKKNLRIHEVDDQRGHYDMLKQDSMTDRINRKSIIGTLPSSQKSLKEKDDSQIKLKKNKEFSNNTQSSVGTLKTDESMGQSQIKKLKWIRKNILGFNTRYLSQLQIQVEALYVDHTATNRPFQPVEEMIQYAKTLIANPHTEFSRYGKYSTELMHQALVSMMKSFKTTEDQFVALPTGSGSTGAIEKAIQIIRTIEWGDNAHIFIAPYEHHSNILPWIEFYESVTVLEHDQVGNILIQSVEQQLRKQLKQKKSLIVSISAASNVTSQITDVAGINRVIAKLRDQGHENIIFSADCAAFCCHHQLDLEKYNELDFAFLSPHKNLGGAQSCGILLARKSLFNSSKPTFPGGGTVRFVKGYSKKDVLYQVDPFSREIAGTPPFLGFYRAALSFELLTNVIGYEFIHKREKSNTSLFVKLINESNDLLKSEGKDIYINIYGETNLLKRANVITFNFEYGNQYIQHSFASLIFTDVFGIQIRSGCFCAGPFGIELLKIDSEKVQTIEEEVEAGIMINKPGYLRLDLTFYLEDYEVEYIAAACLLIAKYWRNFAKLYTICNNGQILLLPIFKKRNEIYSLADLKKVQRILQKDKETKPERLQRRKKTLELQLKRARSIAQNPLSFLKSINKGERFPLDYFS